MKIKTHANQHHGPRHGAGPGNQNARRHGWYSRLAPASDDALRQATAEALTSTAASPRAAARELHHLARAWAWRDHRETARALRTLARALEAGTITSAAAAAAEQEDPA